MRLQKAILSDIPLMQTMVREEVEKGVILPRSDDEVATNIRSYVLLKEKERLLGYAALHIHSPILAEIRSLVVSPEARGLGMGKALVDFTLREADELGVSQVLVLTYLPDFFRKLGFEEIEKESVPDHKIWADCIKCRHFPNCNEVSLIYDIGKVNR